MLSVLARRFVGAISTCATPLCAAVRGFSTQKPPVNPFYDFNNVTKELRRISEEYHIRDRLPETALLEDLGYKQLIKAIRKKHGGFGAVALKMGFKLDADKMEIHRKLTARAKRRHQRHLRLKMHRIF
ncbi:hypothetical protein ATCC90586_006876 [Pythium insidiosum]|nr:hypothetical protein ATCC90586_006876 [Pythium insidiosum]